MNRFAQKIILLSATAALVGLVGCSKSDTAEASKTAASPQAAAAASAPSVKPDDKPREATFDPNLKPGPIVWDSPEKQKAWEARQAELKKANK